MSSFRLKHYLAALSVVLLAAAAPALAAPKVAMVTSESGLGDKSFNDMMVEGMEKAKAELGAEYVVIQPRSVSDFQSSLARAAGQGFDIIIGSSFDMIGPMQEVAKAFPDQKFGLVDVGPDPLGPNIVSTVTKDWEGSFLVGYIAAKTTKTGTIGFVGGKDIPIIHRFFVGSYYGLAEDGVSAAMDEFNKGLIADDVLAEVDQLKAKLLSGEIVVPNYFDLEPGQQEMGTPSMATPPSVMNATTLAK